MVMLQCKGELTVENHPCEILTNFHVNEIILFISVNLNFNHLDCLLCKFGSKTNILQKVTVCCG